MAQASTPTCGLREQKKRESRAALHRAALELVADQGLDAVRVEDIAQRAGVSTRTFFNYFSGKEQALVNQTPEHGQEIVARLRALPETMSTPDALIAALVDHGVEMARDRTTWRLMRQVTCRHPELIPAAMGANQQTTQALVAAVAERLGVAAADDPYPVVLVESVLAGLRAGAGHHLRSQGDDSPVLTEDELPALREALERAGRMLRSGLAEPPRA